MLDFPLYLPDLIDGIVIGVNANTLKLQLADGRIATVKIKGDEFEATYLGDFE